MTCQSQVKEFRGRVIKPLRRFKTLAVLLQWWKLSVKFKVCKSVHRRTIQTNHQRDATIYQFIILTILLSYRTCCYAFYIILLSYRACCCACYIILLSYHTCCYAFYIILLSYRACCCACYIILLSYRTCCYAFYIILLSYRACCLLFILFYCRTVHVVVLVI